MAWLNFSTLVGARVSLAAGVAAVAEMKRSFYLFPSVSTDNLGHLRDAEWPVRVKVRPWKHNC